MKCDLAWRNVTAGAGLSTRVGTTDQNRNGYCPAVLRKSSVLVTVAAVAALRELPHELFVAEHSLGHRLCRDGLVEPVPCHQVDHLKHGVHRPADGRSVAAVRPLWQLEISRSLRQSQGRTTDPARRPAPSHRARTR